MEIKVKKVEKFDVCGKEFDTRDQAEKYIKDLKQEFSKDYYIVYYDPDLTEGRGYYGAMIISVPKNNIHSLFEYLINTFGKPFSMVQGVVSIKTYTWDNKIRVETVEELKELLAKEVRVLSDSVMKELKHIKLNGCGIVIE